MRQCDGILAYRRASSSMSDPSLDSILSYSSNRRSYEYSSNICTLSLKVLWVDDAAATPADLDALASPDEEAWREERRPYLLY